MVTQANRFYMNKDETISDDLTGKKYATMEEACEILIVINDFLYDFEDQVTRQGVEINALIDDIAGENI